MPNFVAGPSTNPSTFLSREHRYVQECTLRIISIANVDAVWSLLVLVIVCGALDPCLCPCVSGSPATSRNHREQQRSAGPAARSNDQHFRIHRRATCISGISRTRFRVRLFKRTWQHKKITLQYFIVVSLLAVLVRDLHGQIPEN